MASQTQSAIPPGYTLMDFETLMIMSNKGKEIFGDLVKKAGDRNPDAFDMYIYNDFYAYAVLDLVDKTLAAAHTKIAQKAYQDAYHLLEALVLFNDYDMSWPMCDDGDRTKVTNKAHGALVVAMLRGFEAEGKLNTTHLPGLEGFLRTTAQWADQMSRMSCDSSYGAYCKVIGKKLFKDKSPEDVAHEQSWLEEWIAGLDEEDQAEVRKKLKEQAKEKASKKTKPWYEGAGDVDEDKLVLSRVWKQYKQYLSGVPKKPLRGPGTWDISKWTQAQKAKFKFSDGPESDEDYDSKVY
ncbi:hypothetical protein LshimejAT787_0109100 [Lyophyllum shimeji]|uniref:Uncharacterized protein n=1 Tax=Lyophyllum shimeji TaxID=47721 RepID=A0A9P3PDR9_LYOSH|nr:hypothetical protein LshimejAT787_0109100 [Lyophyllum shimeji]